MRPEEIRDHLRAAPFRPFRVFLSDGSSHLVPHPEFAWIGRYHFIVAKAVDAAGLARKTVTCDPLHVTRIEAAPERAGG